MDARTHHAPTLANGLQGDWNERADRREDDRRIERLGRTHIGVAHPLHTDLPREGLGIDVSRTGEGKHRPTLRDRDLRDDVGRRPEAIETELHA